MTIVLILVLPIPLKFPQSFHIFYSLDFSFLKIVVARSESNASNLRFLQLKGMIKIFLTKYAWNHPAPSYFV